MFGIASVDMAAQGLSTGLALSWQNMVLAVAAIVRWPHTCDLPALRAGGWQPYVVTVGQTATLG